MNSTLTKKQLLDFGKTLKLLFVEDDIESREVAVALMSRFFGEVIIAQNGEDGFLKFDSSIDLVITDINMPKLNGLEMIEKIREVDSQIPCMIVTSYDSVENLIRAIELQVDGFIQKPMQREYMVKNLLKVLEKIYFRKQLQEHKLTLEKKLDEKLKELEKKDELVVKQSKHAAMGEMVDLIAHQWLQPLNIISMSVQSFHEFNKSSQIEPKIKNCSDGVKKQVEHLVATLNQFRNFFRPNTNSSVCNLLNILDSLNILLSGTLSRNFVTLNINCDSFIQINAYENEIKHIFINLINNSIEQYNTKNIKDDREINIDVSSSSNKVKVEIKDTAGGIEESLLDKVFEPNFTTKDHLGGTGVGLYMAKLILNKYYADISVKNLDGGACFTIEFNI